MMIVMVTMMLFKCKVAGNCHCDDSDGGGDDDNIDDVDDVDDHDDN